MGSLTETEPVNMDLEEIEVLHPFVLPLLQTGPYVTKKIVTSAETQPTFEKGQISLPFFCNLQRVFGSRTLMFLVVDFTEELMTVNGVPSRKMNICTYRKYFHTI